VLKTLNQQEKNCNLELRSDVINDLQINKARVRELIKNRNKKGAYAFE